MCFFLSLVLILITFDISYGTQVILCSEGTNCLLLYILQLRRKYTWLAVKVLIQEIIGLANVAKIQL